MSRITFSIVVLIAAAGCVRRVEVIAVYSDGAADLVAIFEGAPADVHEGDAIPSDSNGWKTREDMRVLQEGEFKGEKILEYAATLHVPAGKALPASYAKAGTPLEGAALAMPAEIKVEQREDGTHYAFTRTYRSRRWSATGLAHHPLLESEELGALQMKKAGELTGEERQKLASALVDYECVRHRALIDAAAASVGSAVLPDKVRDLCDTAGKDATKNAERIEHTAAIIADNKNDAGVYGVQKALRAALVEKFKRALDESAHSPAERVRLRAAYDKLELELAVTEDLVNDNWEVVVFLPGKITAHDADGGPATVSPDFHWGSDIEPMPGSLEVAPILKAIKAARTPGGYQLVKWEMCGGDMVEHDVVLRASSFVAKQ